MTWFYMSFADANLPKGEQFLGGCYVEADSFPEALTWTHIEGVNPSGEIQFYELPDEAVEAHVPTGDRFRLLTRAEIEAQS